jgi:hypothetical protein
LLELILTCSGIFFGSIICIRRGHGGFDVPGVGGGLAASALRRHRRHHLLRCDTGLELALRDGDGDVVGEEVAEHDGVQQRGEEERRHRQRGGHPEADAQRLREHVLHLRRVADGGDRGARHGERVRPPRQREAEPPEQVDAHSLHVQAVQLVVNN